MRTDHQRPKKDFSSIKMLHFPGEIFRPQFPKFWPPAFLPPACPPLTSPPLAPSASSAAAAGRRLGGGPRAKRKRQRNAVKGRAQRLGTPRTHWGMRIPNANECGKGFMRWAFLWLIFLFVFVFVFYCKTLFSFRCAPASPPEAPASPRRQPARGASQPEVPASPRCQPARCASASARRVRVLPPAGRPGPAPAPPRGPASRSHPTTPPLHCA